MSTINITAFGGEMPSVSARQLGPSAAKVNSNLLLTASDFRPLANNRQVTSGSGETLYKHNRKANGALEDSETGGWVTNAQSANYVKSQVDDDLTDRTYYSFNDGVTPPRVMDVLGVDKPLGITPPAKPTVTVNSVAEFSPSDREAGIEATKQAVASAIRASAVTRLIGGVTGVELGTTSSTVVGYLDALWDGPKQVRTYRMGSTGGANTGALTDAYSTAPLSAFSWIRDASLSGFWASTDATSPSWQGGAGVDHWCLTFPAFATGYEFVSSTLRAALAAVQRPGEAAGVQLFTSAQLDGADGIVARLMAYTSQSNPVVAPLISALKGELKQLRLLLDQGSAASLSADRSAFYSQTAIANEITAAFNNFSQAINTDAAAYTARAASGTSYTTAQIKAIALARWAADTNGIYRLDGTQLETDMRAVFATVATGTASVQAEANAYDPKPLIRALDAAVGEAHFSTYAKFNTSRAAGQIAPSIVAKKAAIQSYINSINSYYAWLKDESATGVLAGTVADFYTEKNVADNVKLGVTTVVEARFYVMTWVTSWGEESAPSPVSDMVEVDQNDSCTISWSSAPTDQKISGWRLYRTNSGSQSTQFQAVVDAAIPGTVDVSPVGTPTQVVSGVYTEIGRTGALAPNASEIAYWVNLQASKDLNNKDLRLAMLYAAITFEGDPVYGAAATAARALIGTGALVGLGALIGDATGFSINRTSVLDTQASADLGEVLPTTTWLPPPPNLQGLVGMANGVMAGFYDNALCFCEPYVGYAWPVEYQITVKYPIVGLGAFGQSVFVGTKGNPYIVTGADSASMSAVEVPSGQACVSRRSIVPLSGGVMYASPDGLCVIDASGGAKVVTAGVFTKEDWMALKPSSIVACWHDGVYYFTYNTGSASGAYSFDASSGKLGRISLSCTAMYNDLVTDTLYFIDAGSIYAMFGANTRQVGTYKTGIIKLPKPASFAWLQVDSDFSSSVTVNWYGNGALVKSTTVSSISPVRLPPGVYLEHEVEIITSARVTSVTMASSTLELQSV